MIDVVIVGAGTAGLSALREVRKRTEDFLLVNKPPYGTTCARVGCMPSKALIASANALHASTRLAVFGIRGGEALAADVPAVLGRVRRLRDHFVSGVMEATADLGNRNISGHARLDGPNKIVVGDRVIEARQIILAPGSAPIVPKPWKSFGDRVLTTDTLFEQNDLPQRISVIGLGAVGIEIAQALARLGLQVTAFDTGSKMGGLSDEKVANALRECVEQEFDIHLGAEVELVESNGAVKLCWDDRSQIFDKVVAAVGRQPNVAGLGLDTLGVPLNEQGLPEVDPSTMRIGETPVLLAGDANGSAPLLHEGADDGHIAGLNATSDTPIRLDRRTPLAIVFSDPEVAIVGQSAASLEGEEILIGEVSFSDQGRARIMQENRGMARIYARPGDGRLLGAEMAAPAAEHLAHLLALAIGREFSVHDLLRMPYYHPTIEEGLRSALRAISRDLPPCSISDLAACGPLDIEALE